MKNSRTVLFAGLAVITLNGISAFANVSAQESLMATLDKDLDGLISLKEAAAHATLLENFNLIDVNEDGYISMDELIASEISKG